MSVPFSSFVTVWGLLAMNIASPGPNVLNTIATAMGSGRAAAIGSAAGVGIGVSLWCLAITLGVASVFALWPWAQVALTIAAIALLARFSWRYLGNAWRGYRTRQTAGPHGVAGLSAGKALRRSLAINALNPKALTTWLAILTIFPVAAAGPGDIAILCAGAAAVALGLHLLYALVFSTPLAARAYLRAAWVLSLAAGLFFAGFALRIAIDLVRTAS